MTTKVAAVIVAGGRGVRAGGEVPKQYRQIGGDPLIRSALAAFAGHPQIEAVQPVIHAEDEAAFQAATAGLAGLRTPVPGGASRQASVYAGLKALRGEGPDIVLIHDAARPFVSRALIERAIAAGSEYGAAVPAIAVADTVKKVDAHGTITATIDRSELRIVQTPQAFSYNLIVDAHGRAARSDRSDFTDDAALAEWAGHRVNVFPAILPT